jgi:hypothetical protein
MTNASAPRKPFLPPRWFIRAARVIQRAIYRVSGGRIGLRKPTPKTYGMMRVDTIPITPPYLPASRSSISQP